MEGRKDLIGYQLKDWKNYVIHCGRQERKYRNPNIKEPNISYDELGQHSCNIF